MVNCGGWARLTTAADAMAIDKQTNRYEFMFPEVKFGRGNAARGLPGGYALAS